MAPGRVSTFTAAMHPVRVPGASITVMDGNRVAWSRQWGVRSLGGAPVDVETRFTTCSMTKTVNGMLFYKKATEAGLDLDIPVVRVIVPGLEIYAIDEDRVGRRMMGG